MGNREVPATAVMTWDDEAWELEYGVPPAEQADDVLTYVKEATTPDVCHMVESTVRLVDIEHPLRSERSIHVPRPRRA